MRQLLLWCGVGLVVAGCAGDGTGPPPPPVETLSATLTASGNGQAGAITTTLPLPLRVVVHSASTQMPGVHVDWHASSGTLAPQSGVTDAEGIATATWTLDTVAGAQTATATVPGLRDTVTFAATALASGPAVSIRKIIGSGNNQIVGANAASFPFPLRAVTVDRYGNRVPGQVTWTIESGPVTFIEPPNGPTNADGFSTARLRPVGTEGGALVRASLAGGAAAVDFTLTVGPPQYVVLLRSSIFVSVQNGTRNPAVDTIPAGQTVVWKLDFDYEQHRVVSVGTPSFPSPGDFPYALNPEVSATFTVPGTYHYTDFYNSSDASGVVVVE